MQFNCLSSIAQVLTCDLPDASGPPNVGDERGFRLRLGRSYTSSSTGPKSSRQGSDVLHKNMPRDRVALQGWGRRLLDLCAITRNEIDPSLLMSMRFTSLHLTSKPVIDLGQRL
jgi:hypothetical protein